MSDTPFPEIPPVGGLVPYLSVEGASDASAFYQRAFDAAEMIRLPAEDGKRLMHCQLKVNGGDLMIRDSFPEYGDPYEPLKGCVLHLQFKDEVDPHWEKAVAAGCEVVLPLQLMFWGDRYGQLRDPYGVLWSLASTPAKT